MLNIYIWTACTKSNYTSDIYCIMKLYIRHILYCIRHNIVL